MKRYAAILIALLLVCAAVGAVEIPKHNGPINDLAGLLSAPDVRRLEAKALGYREKTGNEIGVLIVRSLDGQSLENFAHDVFRTWGIGQKEKNNGVLFLVALQEHKARIEVGYGLEADLTDLECGRLVDRDSPMAEEFRANDFTGGIDAVLDGIVVAIGGEYNPPPPKNKKGGSGGQTLIFLVFGVIWFVMLFRRRTRGMFFGGPFIGGGGGRSGGGGGGGFTFGGGFSGGGGASGGW